MFRRIRPYVLLFLGLSAVYHANLRPIASGDSLSAALIPLAVVLDGSLALDRFGPYIQQNIWYSAQAVHLHNGHWYSSYPIAGPVLLAPAYLPLVLIPAIRHMPPGELIALARILEKIMAVALASLSAVFLLVLLQRLTRRRWAWLLTLAFALGTGNWSTSSQALWQHTFGQLAVIGCLYCLECEWFWICGVCAGCALMIRPTNLAIVPALLLALGSRFRSSLKFLAAPVAGAILVLTYNYNAFGTFGGGYPVRLTTSLLTGLPGILISPGRGLLLYTPLVAFAACAFLPLSHESRKRHAPLFIAASLFAIIQLGVTAKWENWWGGYCWGPRLLTEILPPAMVLIALGIPVVQAYRWKIALVGVAAYCCLVQALGVFFYPKGHWDDSPKNVNAAPERLWDWRDNPIFRTARGGLAWEPYAVVWTAATKGIPAASQKLRETGVHPY